MNSEVIVSYATIVQLVLHLGLNSLLIIVIINVSVCSIIIVTMHGSSIKLWAVVGTHLNVK